MITCPICQTVYTPERLGLTDLLKKDNVTMAVDVKCPVCQTFIHATVTQRAVDRRMLSRPWKKSKVVEHEVVIAPSWANPQNTAEKAK